MKWNIIFLLLIQVLVDNALELRGCKCVMTENTLDKKWCETQLSGISVIALLSRGVFSHYTTPQSLMSSCGKKFQVKSYIYVQISLCWSKGLIGERFKNAPVEFPRYY